MNIDKIPAKTKNSDFNVIIEIPMNDNQVKYEFNKVHFFDNKFSVFYNKKFFCLRN